VSTCPEKRPFPDLKRAWLNGDPRRRLETIDTHVFEAEERRTIDETPKTPAELEQLKQIEDVLRGRGELRELRRSGLR
jgi:hypothetical protein